MTTKLTTEEVDVLVPIETFFDRDKKEVRMPEDSLYYFADVIQEALIKKMKQRGEAWN